MEGAAPLLDLDPFEWGPNHTQLANRNHQPNREGLATNLDGLVGSTSPRLGPINAKSKDILRKRKYNWRHFIFLSPDPLVDFVPTLILETDSFGLDLLCWECLSFKIASGPTDP